MSAPALPALRAALEPVRQGLLARARADADAALARADADAEAALAQARAQAEQVLAAARAEGEREGAVLRARERARSQRAARETVLRAQGQAYRDLRDRARTEARGLRDAPGYPALLDRLRARAEAELGPDADVRSLPDGGVVAEAAGRRLVLSLDALADEALDRLGAAVEQLWTP